MLAELVQAARHYRLSPEESAWIARIEQERTRLERSDHVLRTPRSLFSLDPADGVVLERTVGEFCRTSSKPKQAATLLFALVRLLRPERVLEMGTAVGISAAYQGAALCLNGGGRLITVEGSPASVEVARDVVDRLSLSDTVESRIGLFDKVVPEVLADGGPGYVFIDGEHAEKATLRHFELVEPHLLPPGIVVFDDVGWSDEMKRALSRLRQDERVVESTDAYGMGLCVYR